MPWICKYMCYKVIMQYFYAVIPHFTIIKNILHIYIAFNSNQLHQDDAVHYQESFMEVMDELKD